MPMNETLQVRIKSVSYEADGIFIFELRPLPPLRELPAFTAGSHIDLHLPNGMLRSYSLINDEEERHRYVVAINKDQKSRGGSRYMHEVARAGDAITIGHPRNNFPLNEESSHSIFIAGGIGITPLWSMIQRLGRLNKHWELYYASRTRKNAAFLEQLQKLGEGYLDRLHLTFDAEPGSVMLNLTRIVEAAPPNAHLYCCGPVLMIEAFEKATAAKSPDTVHVEYFVAKEKPSTDGGFEVALSKTGRIVMVPAGKTILDTLLDLGIDVPYSCAEGICGTCEVKVLEGIPDHRDLVLSASEKASNQMMLICCSGSKSPKLVLDL